MGDFEPRELLKAVCILTSGYFVFNIVQAVLIHLARVYYR